MVYICLYLSNEWAGAPPVVLMGFSFRLAAMKGMLKKKKKVKFEGLRRRRIVVIKPDTKLSGDWYSLVSSLFFRKLLIASSSAKRPPLMVSLTDSGDQYKSILVSSSLPHDDHSDTYVSLFYQIFILPEMRGYIISAKYGLLCVKLGRRIRIYNLTTNQHVYLPIILRPQLLVDPNDFWTTFGHDHVQDEYKLLNIVSIVSKEERIVRSEHQVLVLGPKASWRNTKGHTYPHQPYTHTIMIGSVLYYGVLLDHNKFAVMSFDFTSEDFNLIDLPVEVETIRDNRCSMMNYKNKVAVIEYSNLISNLSSKFSASTGR